MRPDLAIMYFEQCLEELPLDEDERACYELAIAAIKRWNGRNTEVIVIDERHREEYGPFDLDNR